jgi:uncharacterized protein YfdQ (DUF2303 family)
MLNKETLKALQEATITQPINSGILSEGLPALLLPDGYSVKDIEHLQPSRYRFRGQLSTGFINDFINYTKARLFDDLRVCAARPYQIMVDGKKMTAKAFFNLGNDDNPGHGDDTAILTLETNPPLASLRDICGKRLSQLDLAAWLEDWANYLKAEKSDGESMDIKHAINAVRKITIEQARTATNEAGNLSATRSVLESIDANKNNDKPTYFTLTCRPHQGFEPRDFKIELSTITSEDKPMLKLRIVREEDINLEISEEFKEKIGSSFNSDQVSVYSGTFTL